MDICLNDPQAIRKALKIFKNDNEIKIDDKSNNKIDYDNKNNNAIKLPKLEGSIMEKICKTDPTRRETFMEIGFFPTIKLL